MAKIDLYDPKWVDMVFADKNQAYGAYRLRKGTSGRNIKALLILIIAAALVGGFLAWKVISQRNAEAQQAYMEAMQLAKLQQEAKKNEKKEVVQPKVQPKKEIPVARETQKFVAPVIKKDELVKESNTLKQMDQLDDKVMKVRRIVLLRLCVMILQWLLLHQLQRKKLHRRFLMSLR